MSSAAARSFVISREYEGVQVLRQSLGGADRAMADGETTGLVKIVTGRREKIRGGHIIGPEAGNLIHEVVLAMQKNIPVRTLSTSTPHSPRRTSGPSGTRKTPTRSTGSGSLSGK